MFEELKKIYDNGKPSKLICKKYKKEYDYLLYNTKFLDDQVISSYKIKIVQRLYHLIYNIRDIPKCKYCGNLVEFNSYREYRIYCCNKCKIKDANYAERNKRAKNTKKIKYGDANYNNSKKIKETKLKKYGDPCYTNKEKMKQTKLEKYGNAYFSNWEKGKNTCKERYGVNSNLWIKEVRDKIKQDNIIKYGYEHHTKSPDYSQGFNNKKYLFKGKYITVQGYEDLALNILLSTYEERNIIVGKHEIFKYLGKIEYYYDNQKHIYFPDIFLISEKLIIEVKSLWTFEMKKEINLLKRDACLQKGFNFNFWVFSSPEKVLII